MLFFNRLVTTVTYVVDFFSFSAFPEFRAKDQSPLLNKLDHVSRPHDSVYTTAGAIFVPDTGDIACDYTAMGSAWTSCNTPENRTCWLKNSVTGEVFDINTDYEDKKPIGIDRFYTLNLTDGVIDADGIPFTEGKFFLNASLSEPEDPDNRYPGPWVQACWGDTVHVTVNNNLKFNGTTIHWHGIRQNHTNHMDGVPGITQSPIAPADSFTYNWTATQYGSSWYHSHYSLQYADGALGPLTIHGPTSDHWDEPRYPVMMTDWGHNGAFQAIWGPPGLGIQSTLLNGKGNVTRYNNAVANTTEIPQPFNITVSSANSTTGKANKYLLQLINTSFESNFVFTIDNHTFTVISSDFVPVEPYNTTNVTISIGQRYEIILIAEPEASSAKSFWMRAYRPPCFKANNDSPPSPGSHYEKAGLVFYDDETSWPDSSVAGHAVDQTLCADEPYDLLHPVLPWSVGEATNEEDNLSVIVDKDPEMFPLALFSIGGEDFNPLQIDYSNPTFLNLGYDGAWPPRWVVYPENYTDESWVYLLLKGSSNAGSHPIHLHGHDFAILQQTYNETYNNSTQLNLKLDNPPRRDVVLLPQGGFVVIAFKTDNPGTWLMHCHIAQHASFGLALQILERQTDAFDFYTLPDQYGSTPIKEAQRVTNNWNRWWGNCQNWWYNPQGGHPGEFCDAGNQGFSPDSGI
ncbi:multicopper oxidase [Myriangium duriaei CBS 260.36]|uniref:Multicopper oxidase n=1 Tax=Myriangium duriaei CBS 260.36 TaxID=1168546 RepID=A0A9P4IZU4_9PEZI|nr:multicopper oxidase [Myriangium duriaei CBS 260.36]